GSVFAGTLRGRHARASGANGSELVTIEGGGIAATEFVELLVVRWHAFPIDASELDNIDALASAFRSHASSVVCTAPDRLHAVRVVIEGESFLHAVEAGQPGAIVAAIQAAAQEFDDVDIWVEQVRLNLRSP